MKLYMVFLEEPKPLKPEEITDDCPPYPHPIYIKTNWMDLIEKMNRNHMTGNTYYIAEVKASDYTIGEWLEKSLLGDKICVDPTKAEIVRTIKMKAFR